MTIYLPEYLNNFPLPDVSSEYNISPYFKKDQDYTFVYNLEKIIRKQSTITLKWTLNKADYILFLDFFLINLQEGFNECILDIEKDGILKKIRGDFVDGIEVEVLPTKFNISALFIIKQDII